MGILNVTPDSFSDGGRFNDRAAALKHAQEMVTAGARIIDVGGESTRPGAEAVGQDEELNRVVPVIEAITTELDVVVSVDTSNPAVMREAAAAGAGLINDVRALQQPGAVEVAAETGLPVCVMHMKGDPATMQDNPSYSDVVSEVCDFLRQRSEALAQAGIDKERVLWDPGFGFGKTSEHNLHLLKHLDLLTTHANVVIGLSRKRLFADILNSATADRTSASVAAALLGVQRGAAIVRVHDVAQTVDALKVLQAVDLGYIPSSPQAAND